MILVLVSYSGCDKIPQAVWFKNHMVFFSQFWMLEFKIKLSVGLVPSEGYGGESVTVLLLTSCWFANKSLPFFGFCNIPISAFIFTWCSPISVPKFPLL